MHLFDKICYLLSDLLTKFVIFFPTITRQSWWLISAIVCWNLRFFFCNWFNKICDFFHDWLRKVTTFFLSDWRYLRFFFSSDWRILQFYFAIVRPNLAFYSVIVRRKSPFYSAVVQRNSPFYPTVVWRNSPFYSAFVQRNSWLSSILTWRKLRFFYESLDEIRNFCNCLTQFAIPLHNLDEIYDFLHDQLMKLTFFLAIDKINFIQWAIDEI